eukprot:GGOE01023840.1.p1 GENE.GGOE01023840.1~~GGOE01023840.1.p1  ORF type:complete len:137 (+),score=4.65 GGOE01023840.1:423-833(+)
MSQQQPRSIQGHLSNGVQCTVYGGGKVVLARGIADTETVAVNFNDRVEMRHLVRGAGCGMWCSVMAIEGGTATVDGSLWDGLRNRMEAKPRAARGAVNHPSHPLEPEKGMVHMCRCVSQCIVYGLHSTEVCASVSE